MGLPLWMAWCNKRVSQSSATKHVKTSTGFHTPWIPLIYYTNCHVFSHCTSRQEKCKDWHWKSGSNPLFDLSFIGMFPKPRWMSKPPLLLLSWRLWREGWRIWAGLGHESSGVSEQQNPFIRNNKVVGGKCQSCLTLGEVTFEPKSGRNLWQFIIMRAL